MNKFIKVIVDEEGTTVDYPIEKKDKLIFVNNLYYSNTKLLQYIGYEKDILTNEWKRRNCMLKIVIDLGEDPHSTESYIFGYTSFTDNLIKIVDIHYYFLNENLAIKAGFNKCSEHNVYYSRRCIYCIDEYNLTDSEVKQGKNILGTYHNVRRKNFIEDSIFGLGIEIEKEDDTIELNWKEVYNNTTWNLERDGSLNGVTGFELVSPALPFNISQPIYQQEDWLAKYIYPVRHILDAKYSNSCGGHIHLSEKNKENVNLYHEFKYMLPIVYALYINRIDSFYCKAKRFMNSSKSSDKYQAVAIRGYNTIEFRILDAVRDMNCLLDRIELIRLMLIYKSNITNYSELYNYLIKDNPLTLHIRTKFLHNDNEEYNLFLQKLISMIIKFG